MNNHNKKNNIMPDTQQPFGEEIHSAEIVPMNRVGGSAPSTRKGINIKNIVAEAGAKRRMNYLNQKP